MTSEKPREGAELRATARSERRTISTEPLTVEIVPNEQLQGQIGTMARSREAAQTLRLEVEGVASEWNPEVGIRVFLNYPQSDASTSTDDPHYVTTFSFFEHKVDEQSPDAEHGHRGDAPQTFYANLTPTIQDLQAAGLYREGDSLQATLVTVPIAQDRLAQKAMEAAIPFTGISVSLQS